MNLLRKNIFFVNLLIGVVSLGCSNTSTPTANPQYFLLSNSPSALTTRLAGQPEVSIRAVNLPAYLNSTGLATLKAAGKVSISLKKKWAEKLSQSLPILIANELEALIKKPVETHPLPPGIQVKTIIEIQIEQLIGDKQTLYLKANYRLLRRNLLKKYDFYTEIPLANEQDSALIDGHNQAIYALTQAIAKHL